MKYILVKSIKNIEAIKNELENIVQYYLNYF